MEITNNKVTTMFKVLPISPDGETDTIIIERANEKRHTLIIIYKFISNQDNCSELSLQTDFILILVLRVRYSIRLP